MKFARLRLEFRDAPSPIQAALTDCPDLEVAQLRSGGIAPSGPRTYVMSVTGDPSAAAAALADEPGVIDHELVSQRGRHGLVYVRAEVTEIELALRATFTRDSLLSTPPVDVYPDGSTVLRVLGEADDLQRAVAEIGEELSVTVERVGDFDRPPERVAAALTDRQEAAVRAALDLGYYEVPRRATHEDVAAELDCAPSTANEHLRKAEAALVRAAFP